jgi:hypothetical protein
MFSVGPRRRFMDDNNKVVCAGSRKPEECVIDGLHLSSEIQREEQCSQKKK